MAQSELLFLESECGKIAYRQSVGGGARIGIVWLGGFHSDMEGEKATALHAAADARQIGFTRFDYFGHGKSDGRFADGTVSTWRNNVLDVVDRLTSAPLVLVGSSMGGWMALLAALARPERVVGMVLLAPAPDFTEKLIWARLGEAERRQIMERGSWVRPSAYDAEGYPITRDLIEDGKRWSALDGAIKFDGPVRILHGATDTDVPPDHSRMIVEKVTSEDVTWTLIKDGDHRLSRPQDIDRMVGEVMALVDQLELESA